MNAYKAGDKACYLGRARATVLGKTSRGESC